MKNTAISLKGVSKKYSIGKEKDGSLRGTLGGMFSKKSASTEDFWALKDVSFDIQKGDVVGIIGKNGAGKSTLLKILSQITKPSEGIIEINGRVASLLEVGTGFHPELTGRENVFLNGTILGMTRKEVAAKFDEIVAFSGVEKFIDTPVKRYSSGMYVRLAFAVAAHLEPEILIIDEVLAVGDAEFQKKCLGKMKDVAGEGRTVIFVSHNLAAVKALCNKGVVIDKGRVLFTGDINSSVDRYNSSSVLNSAYQINNSELKVKNENIIVKEFSILNSELTLSSEIKIKLVFENIKSGINLSVSLLLFNSENVLISEFGFIVSDENNSKDGTYELLTSIPSNLLNADTYYFSIMFGENQKYVLLKHDEVINFEILNEIAGNNLNRVPGVLRMNLPFTINQ